MELQTLDTDIVKPDKAGELVLDGQEQETLLGFQGAEGVDMNQEMGRRKFLGLLAAAGVAMGTMEKPVEAASKMRKSRNAEKYFRNDVLTYDLEHIWEKGLSGKRLPHLDFWAFRAMKQDGKPVNDPKWYGIITANKEGKTREEQDEVGQYGNYIVFSRALSLEKNKAEALMRGLHRKA